METQKSINYIKIKKIYMLLYIIAKIEPYRIDWIAEKILRYFSKIICNLVYSFTVYTFPRMFDRISVFLTINLSDWSSVREFV